MGNPEKNVKTTILYILGLYRHAKDGVFSTNEFLTFLDVFLRQ